MNEKEISLESFISSCDNMMIAQEGIKMQGLSKQEKFNALMTGIGLAALTVFAITRPDERIKERKAAKEKEEENARKAAARRKEINEWAERNNVSEEPAARDKMGKIIQNDLINYLKKLATSPELKEYKTQIKDCFRPIKSEHSDYGVQISEFQNGIDWRGILKYEKEYERTNGKTIKYEDLPKSLTNNEWYYTMLSEGCEYIEKKYKYEIAFYNFSIDTGDGDEANIYIN